MERILSCTQITEADRSSCEIGIPIMVLMERAALALVEEILRLEVDRSNILVVCGTGNNGGDGLAAARILSDKGYTVSVYLAGSPEKYSKEMKQQLLILEKYPVSIEISFHPEKFSLIIDALFGTGLHRVIKDEFAELIEKMNKSGRPIVSVDMPSGIHTDTGAVMGCAARASFTVTFTCRKPGLCLYPGIEYAGNVFVRQIGIHIPEKMSDDRRMFYLKKEDISQIPHRDESGNKGTFKKILVIAGSRDIFGAAYLSAKAALMAGTGMVRVYTEENNRQALCTLLPEALFSLYKEKNWNDEQLIHDIQWADGILIGPGLGMTDTSLGILRTFLKMNKNPAVMDADALNLMAAHPDLWNNVSFPCLITPHVAEMSRLTGISTLDIKENLIETAEKAASDLNVTCILKDAVSIIAVPGQEIYVNMSGNSSLATAGSGDVLSGLAAGLFTMFPDLKISAAALAAYIHGLTGERASEKYSRSTVTAGTLFEFFHEFLQ